MVGNTILNTPPTFHNVTAIEELFEARALKDCIQIISGKRASALVSIKG
jgi:hypothetical protein